MSKVKLTTETDNELPTTDFALDRLRLMRSEIHDTERQAVMEIVDCMSPGDMHDILTNYLSYKAVIKAIERREYDRQRYELA